MSVHSPKASGRTKLPVVAIIAALSFCSFAALHGSPSFLTRWRPPVYNESEQQRSKQAVAQPEVAAAPQPAAAAAAAAAAVETAAASAAAASAAAAEAAAEAAAAEAAQGLPPGAARYCPARFPGAPEAVAAATRPVTWQEIDALISQPSGVHGRLQKAGLPWNYAGALRHMVNMVPGHPPGLPTALTKEVSVWLYKTRGWQGSPTGSPTLRSPIPACHYLVDHKNKVIFVRGTKIGGTTIADMLGIANHPIMCNWQPKACEDGCAGRPLCMKYMTSPDSARLYWMNYTVFGFARNPYARAISSYHFIHKRAIKPECQESFATFAKAPTRQGQLCYDRFQCCKERFGFVLEHLEAQAPSCFFTPDGQPAVDFLGRAEHLEEDFQDLLVLLNERRNGSPPLNISAVPKLNTGAGSSGSEKRRFYAEHYMNSSALCDMHTFFAEDFERLKFPSWDSKLATNLECTRGGAAEALSWGHWQELATPSCDLARPLLASCTPRLGHQWVWDRRVCEARHYTVPQLRASLARKKVVLLGDSHARILYTWLQRTLEGTFEQDVETFPKFYNNALWHGRSRTGAEAPTSRLADLHLDFRWLTTLPQVTQAVRNLKALVMPEVVVLSAASWYYVEKLSLAQLEEHLRELEGAVAEADARAQKAGRTVLWLLLTIPERVRGRSWSSSWHAPIGIVPQYNKALRASRMLHPRGPAVLLDLHDLSKSCLPWCSADGLHANAAVNALAIQLMVNLLALPRELAKADGAPAPSQASQ